MIAVRLASVLMGMAVVAAVALPASPARADDGVLTTAVVNKDATVDDVRVTFKITNKSANKLDLEVYKQGDGKGTQRGIDEAGGDRPSITFAINLPCSGTFTVVFDYKKRGTGNHIKTHREVETPACEVAERREDEPRDWPGDNPPTPSPTALAQTPLEPSVMDGFQIGTAMVVGGTVLLLLGTAGFWRRILHRRI
jgi:hypothetical protein